jgi:hypothetical protein
MANPFDPALFLILQSDVGVSDTAGYTRLLGQKANLQRYLEFANSAIEAGFNVPAALSHMNAPVDINIRLYFSDPPYGPPPPLVAPPPIVPIHPPVPLPTHPQPRELNPNLPVHLPTIGYEASDGTPLTVTKERGGQITGFSGTGKDTNNYSLSTAVVTKMLPGRPNTPKVLWLEASMSITVTTATGVVFPALNFGFRFAPTANLFEVYLHQNNVSTAIGVDYSGALEAGGTAQLARTLYYYQNAFVTQSLQIPASQMDPGLYLPAACSFWPMIGWVDFFAPALQKIAEGPAVAVAAPLEALGSVNLIDHGLPGDYPLSKYLSDALPGVGPALGPLAASFVDTTLPFGPLAHAARWLGLLSNTGTGLQALTAEFTAAYNDWVNWIKSLSAPDQLHPRINPFRTKDGGPWLPPD